MPRCKYSLAKTLVVLTTGRPSTESEGERVKAVAWVDGATRSLAYEFEPLSARKELLERHTHLEAGERSTEADVDALAPDEAGIDSAVEPDRLRVLERARITVRRDPHQRQTRALRDRPSLDLHLARRGPPIRDQRIVCPHDLLYRSSPVARSPSSRRSRALALACNIEIARGASERR